MKPEFIDNSPGNTLSEALNQRLEWLAGHLRGTLDLSIATGYFNADGFGKVADRLEQLGSVRLLIGAEPVSEITIRRKRVGEPSGAKFKDRAFRDSLKALEQGFHDDLNHLGFHQEADALLRRLVAFLRSGKVQVRRYEKGFLHGKAFLFAGDEGVIAGSSNFTAAGLTTNIELNLGHYQPTVVQRVGDWYERLWNEAQDYDLASLYEARYKEYDPYLIYLRVLLERYETELNQEPKTTSGQIPLTTFQNDGIARAKHILDKYHGVLIADGVGLGKTYLVGELIREAVHDRRQRVLLVSPAALRDGTWRTFSDRFQIYLDNLSFEELADDRRLRGDGTGTIQLKEPPDRYAMVVIDESHAFRNPDTDRSWAIRQLLRGDPPKKLVLVTATPVNNSLWDLYYLLTYFVKHDAVFADIGIPSLKRKFDDATKVDPYDLRPDALFDLLDKVTVRRTRNFVRHHYPHERIKLHDGREVRVQFPDPKVYRIDYKLGPTTKSLLKDLAAALAPATGHPKLTMARYVPTMHLKKGEAKADQMALAGLLRAALLKRFESSVHSFASTCEKMADHHDRFLQVLAKGYIATSELLREVAEDPEGVENLASLVSEHQAEPASLYKVDSLRKAAAADRDLLRDFADRARKVTRDQDEKLASLANALLDILKHARAEAQRRRLTKRHEHNYRKVLIFTYYEDTVEWITPFLQDLTDSDPRFAPYKGRIASAAGHDSREGVSREDAIFGFAPESSEAPQGRNEDKFDILVATDVLAEGLNLQQCGNIINYDLPWNPMRLVQRHGRIDRIGSEYAEVRIGCFFPAAQLESLLDLEERLRQKLALAAASIGVEAAPLPGAASHDTVFADTRRQIEALRDEQADIFVAAGEGALSRSGEEFRQELRKGLEEHAAILQQMPWGAGSGMAQGLEDGCFFCIRILDKVFLRFVYTDPARPILRESLPCLGLIACKPDRRRHLPQEALGEVYGAWQRARKDAYTDWMWSTDPMNLQPRVRPLFHEVADHLRKHPPADLKQEELDQALASIVAPWGVRIEREVRDVFRRDDLGAKDKSAALIKKVRELGLQPYKAPEPLDIISEDEVNLVCWMLVRKD